MKNPFFVLATQNPIEQEGTYPLPEAQLDRFLFLIKVDYPTATRKKSRSCGSARRTRRSTVSPVLNGEDIIGLQHIVRRVPVSDKVFALRQADHAAVAAGHAGGGRLRQQVADVGRRPAGEHEPDPGGEGARPACAARNHVAGDDVVAVATPILRHRLILNFAAQSEGVTIDEVIRHSIKTAAKAVAA